MKNLYGRGPIVLDFGDPLYLDNPYPVLAALRNSAAVSKGVRAPPYGSAWVATRYAEVLTVLKDSRFSVEPRHLSGGKSMERWWMPRSFRLVTEGLLNKDDPDHYRLRNLVHKAFTPRLIEALQTHIEKIADDLLDDLDKRNPIDLMQAFAVPLPLAVISHMLGVPARDRLKFRRLMKGTITGSARTGLLRILGGAHLKYFADSAIKHFGYFTQAKTVGLSTKKLENRQPLFKSWGIVPGGVASRAASRIRRASLQFRHDRREVSTALSRNTSVLPLACHAHDRGRFMCLWRNVAAA